MRDTMRPGDHCGGDVMTEAGNDPRATGAFVVRSPRANLLVVVLAAAAIAGCGHRSGATAPPPLPVGRVASVIEEDVPIPLEYVATRARTTSPTSPRWPRRAPRCRTRGRACCRREPRSSARKPT